MPPKAKVKWNPPWLILSFICQICCLVCWEQVCICIWNCFLTCFCIQIVFVFLFEFVSFSSVLPRLILSNLLSRVLGTRDPVQLRFYQVSTLKSSEDPIYLSRRLNAPYTTLHNTARHFTTLYTGIIHVKPNWAVRLTYIIQGIMN